MSLKRPMSIVFVAFAAALLTAGVYAALMLWSATRPVFAQSAPDTLDGLVADWAALPDIPGAILFAQQGEEVIYAGAFGTLRKDGGAALTTETPFHTASVGKLFTAVTVLRLHERGALDIDAPAARYLGASFMADLLVVDGIDYGEQITIRQLLSHRAGLGNTDKYLPFNLSILTRPNRVWAPQDLIEQARRVPPAGRPGEQTQYSSPGYFLLGLVIEAVTGQPYHQAVRREVFAPLGMDATFERTYEWRGEVQTLHHYAGWNNLTDHNPSFEFADGGFVTTAQDLARFGIAMARSALFEIPQRMQLLLSPPDGADPTRQYCALGPRLIFHNGSWGVRFIVLPDEDAVAVIALGQTGARTKMFWDAARALLIGLF